MIPNATPVPDTTAWAAEHLRGLGWTVVEPVEVGSTQQPKVGQVWTAEGMQPCTVLRVARDPLWGWHPCVTFTMPDPGPLCRNPITILLADWLDWVRRTNARPLPTPTAGATP